MGGGRNGTTIAPLMPPSSLPRSRATMACADCDASRRSSNGLSRTNRMPRFGAGPEKLKPPTVNTATMSGSVASTFSAWLPTLPVYSSDAPSGP